MTMTLLRTTIRSEHHAKRPRAHSARRPGGPFVEIVFSGDLIVGNDARGRGGKSFVALAAGR
jgi:hypothetical protein